MQMTVCVIDNTLRKVHVTSEVKKIGAVSACTRKKFRSRNEHPIDLFNLVD